MGFSLKEWAKKNLTIPKEFREINIGNTVREAALNAVKRFEQGIRDAGANIGKIGSSVGKIPETVENVNETAKTANMLMWVAIGGAVLIGGWFLLRRR